MSHLSVGLSSAFFICARFAAQLDWCSAFGWWVFCLGVGGFCLEKSFKWGVKLWGEQRLQMISTNRLAGKLLPSP